MKPVGVLWCCLAWLLATAAGPALGDCLATYPADRVTEKLAEPRYKVCSHALKDYAALLGEQGALLTQLRPAYLRKLGPDEAASAGAQTALRLREYDDNRSKLAGLLAAPPKMPTAAASAASAPGGKAAARQWVVNTQVISQSLSARIAVARDEFKAEEKAAYCKQDFRLRVASGLALRLAACFEGE
jgi:hypothetical protein